MRIVLIDTKEAQNLKSRNSDSSSQGQLYARSNGLEEEKTDEMIVRRRPNATYNIDELLATEIIVSE